MGIGSPRLLRKVGLGGAVALAFAPSAHADNPIGPLPVSAPTPAKVPVPSVPTPAKVSVPSVPVPTVSRVAPVQPVLPAQHANAGLTAPARATAARRHAAPRLRG